MGWNDHVDWDLHYAVEEAMERGFLEEEALGYRIAQQVIHSGYESLSAKQRWVYDREVGPALEWSAREAKQDEMRARYPD